MLKKKKERKKRGKEKEKPKKEKGRKKKRNLMKGTLRYTHMVLFFLILLEETITRGQLVLGIQPTLTIPGNQIRSFYFMLILRKAKEVD